MPVMRPPSDDFPSGMPQDVLLLRPTDISPRIPAPFDELPQSPEQATQARGTMGAILDSRLQYNAWEMCHPAGGMSDSNEIRDMLQQEAPWRGIERVSTEELAGIVMDAVQSQLDEAPPEDYEYRKRCVKCLRALSKQYDVLPSQLYILRSSLTGLDDDFLTCGAFADICRGGMKGHPEQICVKRLRIFQGGRRRRERVKKAFCQEALIWRQLRHENILPFYGVSEDIFPSSLCLISPWMEHGNIHDFLEIHPQHNRLGWVWDVAAGIDYLHNLDPCIIHKDIRGANILVGPDLRCLLSDFGISLVAETQMPDTNARGTGNIRWLAPELVFAPPEYDMSLLPQADIYSFGCTIIEMYTGKPPYAGLTESTVVSRLAQQTPPSQPTPDVLPLALWRTVVTRCLSPSPIDRPSAADILTSLMTLDGMFFKKNRGQSVDRLAQARAPHRNT